MVNTYISSSNILTQGFQQPDDIVITAIFDQSSEETIKIYPNPASDILTIEGIHPCNLIELRLTDIAGEIIVLNDRNSNNSSKSDLLQMDITNMQSGVYLLSVIDKNSGRMIHIFRIVKT